MLKMMKKKMMMNRFQNKKAMFLVFSLWVFVLMTIFCYALSYRTTVEVRKTKFLISTFRAHSLAVSGVKAVKQNLLNSAKEEMFEDGISNNQDWATELSKTVEFKAPRRSGEFSAKATDLGAKININLIKEEHLLSLLEWAEANQLVSNAKNISDAILDYIDEDDENRGSSTEENAKNSYLNTIEELNYIKAIAEQDMTFFIENFTVYGDNAKLNINTASNSIINVVLAILQEKHNLPEDIYNQIIEARNDNIDSASKEDTGFSKESWAALLSDAGTFKDKLEEWFTIDAANIFEITSTAKIDKIEKQITSIVDIKNNKTLSWFEK